MLSESGPSDQDEASGKRKKDAGTERLLQRSLADPDGPAATPAICKIRSPASAAGPRQNREIRQPEETAGNSQGPGFSSPDWEVSAWSQ